MDNNSQNINGNDPNFGGGFVGSNGFEDWALENFDLLEFVGEDSSSPFDPTENEKDLNEDQDMHKKDMMYSTIQYNEQLLASNNDQQTPLDYNPYAVAPSGCGYYDQQNGLAPMGRAPLNPVAANVLLDNIYTRQPIVDAALMPSTSKSTPTPTPVIKTEPISEYTDDAMLMSLPSPVHTHMTSPTPPPISLARVYIEQDQEDRPDSTMSGSISASGSVSRPRKYRVKPEYEKANPVYKVKRAKNNDAVRRSRDKAKRLQDMKEERLNFLEAEDIRKTEIVTQLEAQVAFLNKELKRMKQNCTCRANVGQMARRI